MATGGICRPAVTFRYSGREVDVLVHAYLLGHGDLDRMNGRGGDDLFHIHASPGLYRYGDLLCDPRVRAWHNVRRGGSRGVD